MLSKKYDFKNYEQAMQNYWDQHQVYAFDEKAKGDIYSIDTPPPTVSGKIHIGHIFSYTQAEMIARYRRMIGRNVFYPFGFDDNGLPTERLVERDLNIIAKDMARESFIDQCLKSTKSYEDEFKSLWQSMGFSCDWTLQYRTIDETSQRISQRSFIKLAKSKKAYIDESPVLWCTHCHTSIAQAELESKDKETTFSTIKFQADGQPLSIATTRPEMLYGCVAIFIHPDDKRYNHLEGKMCKVPLYDFEVPILLDEQVQMDKGTGIVMCCTFGDTTDLQWYKTYDLPFKKVIDNNGHIIKGIPYIGGLYVEKARKEILEILKNSGLIEKQESIEHSVSMHDRCGTSIEILPSKQWYIDIMTRKADYLKAAEEINWYPAHMKKRYIAWVENLKWNWCVSRQRYYGVPIPVWYCEFCGKEILAKEEDLPINPMTSSPKEACSCGCKSFVPETAVLDTWATSSVTPQINRLWEEDGERDYLKPMTLRTQAHEIIRTWAFYTIVKSVEHDEQIPWEDMMICGFVLAKKGEKISKSKNNASKTPSELIDVHSADTIRYWAANSRLGTDTMFDEEELKQSKRFMTKLWNACKFSLMQLKSFDAFDESKILTQDQWIVAKYHQTTKEAMKYLNQYEVGLARNIIDDFFWKDFCDNYLEYAKDRLYKTDLYKKEAVESGQNALYYVTLGILKLYSIFVPHITEAIYQEFFKRFEGQLSLHQLRWDEQEIICEAVQLNDSIKNILTEVRKYKSERNLSMKESIDRLSIKGPNAPLLYHCIDDLTACCHAKEIYFEQDESFEVKISN